MAKATVHRTTCCRCRDLIEEIESGPVVDGDGDAKGSQPLLYVEGRGVRPIKFDDLCKKCKKRVDHLLGQLRLEKEKPSKDDKKGAEGENPTSTKGRKGGEEASATAN